MERVFDDQISRLSEDLKIHIYQKYVNHIFYRKAFQLLSILNRRSGLQLNTIFPVVVNPVYPFLTVFSLQWYHGFTNVEYLFFLYLARLYHIGVIIHKESFLRHLITVREDRNHPDWSWRAPQRPYFLRWLERFDTLDNWIARVSVVEDQQFLVIFHSSYKLRNLEDSEELMEYNIPYSFSLPANGDQHGDSYVYNFHESYTWHYSEASWSFYSNWKETIIILARLNGIDPNALSLSYFRSRAYNQ